MEQLNQALQAQAVADQLALTALFHPARVSDQELQAAQDRASALWTQATNKTQQTKDR